MEKMGAIMQRPGEDVVPKDEVPRWLKYAGRLCGTVGSGIAIFFGIWNCISLLWGNMSCLIGGMWQMVAGFIVIVIEAPCCCMFIDFVQTLSEWVDKKPYYYRAAFYVLIALPAVILCPGLNSIFGSGFIFVTGILYGMMALGRKGSRDDVAVMASPTGIVTQGGGVDHSSTLMEDPDVWRPT
ncbi:hypothetical protein AAG570_001864 [Ranatra chinensis]|uniref:Calcium channel flower n=1 Tax=Ranatra chinensis TaxID=642074 RepID=A0ABD0YY12_9HEMI